MGILDSAAGFFGAQGASKDLKDLAKNNRDAIKNSNASNLLFAHQLLDMSHPNMSGTDLGNLLFSQGEQQATRQHDIDLATTLRQNLRSGSPLSIADVTGGFDRQNQGAWADRRTNATLQGLTGVLPTSAAIQTAGNLGRNMPATMDPATMGQSIMLDNSKWSTLLSSLNLGGMMDTVFGGGQQQPVSGTANQPARPTTDQKGQNAATLANIIGMFL
jgi:hypothetical protein